MTPEEIRETGAASAGIGLTEPRAVSLARFAIRTRGDSVTRSAWRLEVTCAEGEGAIVCLDPAAEESHYRGEGVFLGWPRERLAAAYEALRPADDSPAFELSQLG
jgi:hypothetical protein